LKTTKKLQQRFVDFYHLVVKQFGCRQTSPQESYIELSLLAVDLGTNVFSEAAANGSPITEQNADPAKKPIRDQLAHSLDITGIDCKKTLLDNRTCISNQ
jgi:hypothetical protein